MKVLMIMNCFRGQAAGECYYQLARELVREGLGVTVLLPQDVDTPTYEEMDGIKVRRFDYWHRQDRSSVAYGLGIPQNLVNRPLARVQFPFFLAALAARGLALAREADVVHVFTNAPGPVGAAARLLWKKPFIMTYIGSDIRDAPGWFNRLLMRFCDRVISATREQTEMIEGLGRTWGVCDVKHLIEFGRFAADPEAGRSVRDEFGLSPDDFVFTFVGRIYDFKDPLTFIRAARLAADREERARFLMVGHGELEQEARDLVRRLGLDDRLIMTGRRSDVDRILAASDVFATLSPVDNCFAATILEAMTARRPCILTDAGYTAEAFPHLSCAYLVPPRDPEAAAEAMIRLMNDGDLRKRLAEAGPGCIDRLGFSRDRVVRDTLNLYKEAAAEAAASRLPRRPF